MSIENNNWSIKEIQDLILEREDWEKKNMYATDCDKCPAGVYYSLTGEKPTNPPDPKGLRRMEVGQMIESNQINKLRSLGLVVETQRRIYDEDFDVSGRHDGLIISPSECSDEAKAIIARKKEIFLELKRLEKEFWAEIDKYREGLRTRSVIHSYQSGNMQQKQDLYDEEFELNQKLLKYDPKNPLILIEIKSITEMGFKYRQKENKPMDSHVKQLMFYLWKLREIYPNIQGRVVYVDTSYQNLLEFDVQYDEELIKQMKNFWVTIGHALRTKEPPPSAPNIVLNPMTNRWQVNYQADWCNYHIKCTGDPQWKSKAFEEVEKLNANQPKKTYARKRSPSREPDKQSGNA